jgi:hypothetical protein
MKQFWANMLVSLTGRIVYPIITAIIAACISWIATKVPFLAPIFNLINPAELAMGIMCLLFTGLLQKLHGTVTPYIKPVQEWLIQRGWILKPDGWIGDKTAHALQEETQIPIREAIAVIKAAD